MQITHKAHAGKSHVYDAYKARYKEVYHEDFKLSDDHLESIIQRHVAAGNIEADNVDDVNMDVIEDMCEEGFKQ